MLEGRASSARICPPPEKDAFFIKLITDFVVDEIGESKHLLELSQKFTIAVGKPLLPPLDLHFGAPKFFDRTAFGARLRCWPASFAS